MDAEKIKNVHNLIHFLKFQISTIIVAVNMNYINFNFCLVKGKVNTP